jgi:hypothetical protein
MQAGTLAVPLQDGAPGITGLAKLGFVPVVMFGPDEKPALLYVPTLFPAAL